MVSSPALTSLGLDPTQHAQPVHPQHRSEAAVRKNIQMLHDAIEAGKVKRILVFSDRLDKLLVHFLKIMNLRNSRDQSQETGLLLHPHHGMAPTGLCRVHNNNTFVTICLRTEYNLTVPDHLHSTKAMWHINIVIMHKNLFKSKSDWFRRC